MNQEIINVPEFVEREKKLALDDLARLRARVRHFERFLKELDKVKTLEDFDMIVEWFEDNEPEL